MSEADKTTVTGRAIGHLKERIASGQLSPGERLPNERDLAAQLNLSRSSMREAIRALTVLGVLEVRRGSGVYVSQLEPGDLLENLGIVAEVSRRRDLRHLIQIRKILEPAAAQLAAARIGPGELRELRGQMSAMEMSGIAEEVVEHDMQFHRVINEAAGNPVLAAILAGLNGRTFRARVSRGRQQGGAFDRTFAEHRRIYRALSDRDPEAARVASAAHICAVEEWLGPVGQLPQ